MIFPVFAGFLKGVHNMSNIQEILLGYTAGEKTTEEVNKELEGTGITFTPGKMT